MFHPVYTFYVLLVYQLVFNEEFIVRSNYVIVLCVNLLSISLIDLSVLCYCSCSCKSASCRLNSNLRNVPCKIPVNLCIVWVFNAFCILPNLVCVLNILKLVYYFIFCGRKCTGFIPVVTLIVNEVISLCLLNAV